MSQLSTNPGVRAVIFDWSGTTIDYGCCAPAAAFVDLFERWNLRITLEEARGPMGMYKRDHIRQLMRLPTVAAQWEEGHGRVFTETDLDAMFSDFVPLQMAALSGFSTLIPGTIDAVGYLRSRGVKIGSTTGYFTEAAQASADAAAEQGYVPDALVCASDVPRARPAPWMLFRNLELLDAYPPRLVAKVGDTPVDMAEGRNAGTWCIGVTRSGNEVGLTEEECSLLPAAELEARIRRADARLLDAGAHVTIESVADLPRAIQEIEERVATGKSP